MRGVPDALDRTALRATTAGVPYREGLSRVLAERAVIHKSAPTADAKASTSSSGPQSVRPKREARALRTLEAALGGRHGAPNLVMLLISRVSSQKQDFSSSDYLESVTTCSLCDEWHNIKVEFSESQIGLSREGGFFRLSFKYDPKTVEMVKRLPHASFDPETKTWTTSVCTQSLERLRQWRWEGFLSSDPDTLVPPGEVIKTVKPAELRTGTVRRPFIAFIAIRDDETYTKLTAIPGARWEKAASGVSYPPGAAGALADLVDAGLLDDTHSLLSPADVVVMYDPRTGAFKVRGDARAQSAFDKNFPKHDVMNVWRERGLDVDFADSFSKEMYQGELARLSEGVQPEGMLVDLYPYQRTDLAVALERSGIGIFSSMGVGKTILGIASGHELMNNRHEVPRVIVVVPPSIRTQWREEICRFTGCDRDAVSVVDGDKKQRMAAYDKMESGEAKWLIVHYQAIILQEDSKRLDKLSSGAFLIFDECHRLKNQQAKTTKVAQSMSKKAARRMGLSGTPIENNPGEWYNILSGLLLPGVFGSPMDFLNRYCYPGKFGGFEGARNIPELRARSKPLYVRHTFNEVASHLPPQRVQTIQLDPKPEYAAALKRAHREARDEIRKNRVEQLAKKGAGVLDGYERDEIEGGAEMTAVGMLKLLCSSPRVVANSESPSAQALKDSGLLPDEDGPKLDELRTMAAEMQVNGERMVVFTGSKRMANLIAERLEEDGVRYVLYTGDTGSKERDDAVKSFTSPSSEENSGPTVFVSTDAGAEGLNLGKQCSTLVNVDIPWTPGRLGQRNARVRRIDSTATSFLVVNLVVRGTIEEGILRMIEHKADLQDAVLGESGGRRATTGRGGKNVFESAMDEWSKQYDGDK